MGDSGTLKSPAYILTVSYLFKMQKRLLKEFQHRLTEHEKELAEYKEKKKKVKEGGPDPGDEPGRPVLGRVVISDCTIEKVAEILADNPRGVLVARDELAGWLGGFQRYKGKGGGSDLPNWLEIFRAGPIVVDRKTGERKQYFVERACASITGGIQPGVLAGLLTADVLDSGGGARLIMAMPPKQPKRWTETEIAPETEEAYYELLDKLLHLEFALTDDGQVPHHLHLSKDAKAVWIDFYNRWAREQAAVEGEMAAAYSKLEGYAARFTLLHHVVSLVARGADDKIPIEKESVEAGVILCRWFANEAGRIYASLTETEADRDVRRLVEWIRGQGGAITAKQLQRSNSRKYPNSDAATLALEALAARALWALGGPALGRQRWQADQGFYLATNL